MNCARVLVLSTMIFATQLPAGVPEAQDAPWPEAEAILAATRHAYENAAAYVDEGLATTFYQSSHGEFTHTLAFTTAFVRGGPFRWEFQSGVGGDAIEKHSGAEWRRYVVWSPGIGASSWNGRTIRHFEKIGQALAGPTGISGGAAVEVPGLLMPDLPSRIRLATAPYIVGQERVGQAACWVLEVRTPRGGSLRLWIDAKTSLVRRVVEEKELSAGPVRTIREYSPVLGDLALALKRTARGLDVESGEGN